MIFDKIYVEVIVKFLKDGGMRPLEIVWADGQRFPVDRVKYIERVPSKVGALIVKRFTVLTCGFEKYLYYEDGKERWFVEKRVG